MAFSRVSVAVGPLPGAIGRHVAGSKSGFFTHTIPRRPLLTMVPKKDCLEPIITGRDGPDRLHSVTQGDFEL
jgi:hypothetical protein